MTRTLGIAALSLITGAVVIVLYAPLLIVMVGSFVPVNGAAFDWSKASLDAYAALMGSRPIIEALLRSLLVSVLAVAASLLFGTILALSYHWSKTALRQVLQLTVFLPFVLPQRGPPSATWTVTRSTGLPAGSAIVMASKICWRGVPTSPMRGTSPG